MSNQITTAFVEQFKANVDHLAQQKGSKLRNFVRLEPGIVGKSAFFDQIGSTNARKRTTRHAPTPRMDTPHARRRVTLVDYDWGDLIDQQDRIRLLIDPASEYSRAAMWALGRGIDDEILDAVDATAYVGEDGTSTQAFDTNMIVDVQVVWPGVSAADTGLNVAKLLEARKLLTNNDVDPDEDVFVPVNGTQITSLLKDERVISGDYNTAMPLQEGKVSKVAGCTLIPCNRATRTDANGDHKVPFFTRSGLLLGIGQDMVGKIAEDPSMSFATSVYAMMSVGATRMEEKRVGYIECDVGGSPTTDA